MFELLGNEILERAFEGYNACIFAYGQTGQSVNSRHVGLSLMRLMRRPCACQWAPAVIVGLLPCGPMYTVPTTSQMAVSFQNQSCLWGGYNP